MKPPPEQETPQRQHLRYRRVGGGYRADDVESTLGGLRRMVRRLEAELEELRARAAALEADLAVARVDLEAYRSQPSAAEGVLEEALRKAAEIEAAAEERAREIVSEAEVQAARSAAPPEPEQAPAADGDEWPPQIQVFEPRLDLDAGPFDGSDAVSTFERALAALGCVDDVYVRSLADGRAEMELLLVAPTRLVPILRAALPYQFHVREAGPARLVLDVYEPDGRMKESHGDD